MASPDDLMLRSLEALADPARLAILRALSTSGPGGASELTDCCAVSQPTVSHHLKVLREAGLIEGDRDGTRIRYSIRPGAIERLLESVAEMRGGRAQGVAEAPPRPDRQPTGPAVAPTSDRPAPPARARSGKDRDTDWRQW